MRNLLQTLQDHDPGYLRIVAELWGIELPPDADAEQLSNALLAAVPELALPEPARRALEHLQRAGGRLAWEQLNRRFGPLREMGAGRRDRLKPWRDPASALEQLWYRGLLGRAFGDSAAGPVEYGFIPTDLSRALPEPEAVAQTPPGEPAAKPRELVPASGMAVDDATTVLAELRRHWPPDALDQLRRRRAADRSSKQLGRLDLLRGFLLQPESLELLWELVHELPRRPAQLKAFLTGSRGEGLAWLQRAWRDSMSWNDLARLGQLQVAESDWPNDPVAGRQAALELLSQVPTGSWWSLDSLIAAVHAQSPSFLRGPGGFDSWYLQQADDGRFLTGFEHWTAVEGVYLRYLVHGPIHWLGGVDLSADGGSFRISEMAAPLFSAEDPPQIDEPLGAAAVRADGGIRVARTADRSLRYQIARFTEWEGAERGAYSYRISAAALQQAEAQGLTAANAASVLNQATGDKLPAGPARALERWNTHGPEAALLRELVLQVEDPKVLERLTEHRTTRRWIKARLDPKRAVVLEADWQRLTSAALGLGLLITEPERRSGAAS